LPLFEIFFEASIGNDTGAPEMVANCNQFRLPFGEEIEHLSVRHTECISIRESEQIVNFPNVQMRPITDFRDSAKLNRCAATTYEKTGAETRIDVNSSPLAVFAAKNSPTE